MSYHARLPEQVLDDPSEWAAIIGGQVYMTLALCRENEPYLVTMNYGYDAAAGCFYFHCDPAGKKMDYFAANPIVWGQVMEDLGYNQVGRCDHAYRSVQFRGRVEFLATREEKRAALELMIDQLEAEPAPVKARLLRAARLDHVVVGRVQVLEMTGKWNEPKGPVPSP